MIRLAVGRSTLVSAVAQLPSLQSRRNGEDGIAVPVTEKQRDFDIESALSDRSATTVDRALHAILDRV
jgi:hypothetical protein